MTKKYIIDTSSLIEMKDKYPQDIILFGNLWNNIENLCKQGRLIAPIEVLKEIERGDDELKEWARNIVRNIFVEPDKEQTDTLKEIQAKYPFLSRYDKPGPNADPWIIALAIVRNEEEKEQLFPDEYIVVTEESRTKEDRIPSVCKYYGIKCINLIGLFRKEGW